MIFAGSLAIGLAAGLAAGWVLGRARVGGAAALALVLATALAALWQPGLVAAMGLRPGPMLALLPFAAAPALLAGWLSDRLGPRSARHALGLAASGVLLAACGLGVQMVMDVPVPLLAAVALTIAWVVLVASIAELASLAPLGLLAMALLVAAPAGLGLGHEAVGAVALAGLLAGVVVGRGGADLLLGRERPWDHLEILAVGVWLAVAASASFLKGAAFAGLLLPASVLAAALVLASLHAFERTLLLRAAPGPD